ncbi:MAG: adenylate/guanylate cyclase domain-containing protein [Humidesulfovibrio sp.]|uniref:adenylate/guanylate cyclase domain-containing protein n=1 Tax=Humidesulfovibrio sp. TaxID=2910988 RepID=UPI0027F2FC60|nr:adenylate/guanylate cyclase domain-containing protein [Humidesulfovibrio sp.]MDQ7836372.1 adenylate/guanylate cyclase domain-containing protein [Humidesulfovibrio sp.]
MRALAHYVFAATITVFYGGRVCPFINQLTIVQWAQSVAVAFALGYALHRFYIRPRVEKGPVLGRVLRLARAEFALFMLLGVALAANNTLVLGFPLLASGGKVVLGCLILGAFAAADLALEEERNLAREFLRTNQEIPVGEKMFPLTRQFALAATFVLFSVVLVVFLILVRDFEWVKGVEHGSLELPLRAVLVEFAFVLAVALAEILNLINSFSRNLRLAFDNENGALMQVAGGNLDTRVVVSSNNEFGLMASYTNRMIMTLGERTRELATAQAEEEKSKLLAGLSASLSKYLSPQIVNSLLTGEKGTELVTQRKKLTVFFSDIKDFTKTTESMQPEDLSSLLNSYFTEMSRIALDYGATIDKFIGDAMLMFFGDPETKGVKADAEACVRMAVAMQRRMGELQGEWRERGYNKPFHMRIGINTGFCNVGNFGSEDRMDYTIIGGEVNLAARLEAQAEPDGILISADTYALVKDIVEAEERPRLEAKGIEREVIPYAVTGIFGETPGGTDVFRKELDGLRIVADLEKVSDGDRAAAIASVQELLARLRGGRTG